MNTETTRTAAPVQHIVSQPLREGFRVHIAFDSDGAAGTHGTIEKVFRSGRCQVRLDKGGFRNLPPEWLTVETEIPRIEAPCLMAWEWTEDFEGICEIDGHTGQIAVRFFRHCGQLFPEVTKLMEYVTKKLEEPTTAEKLCGTLYTALWDRFGLCVEVRWESVSHAPITCRIDPSEVSD